VSGGGGVSPSPGGKKPIGGDGRRLFAPAGRDARSPQGCGGVGGWDVGGGGAFNAGGEGPSGVEGELCPLPHIVTQGPSSESMTVMTEVTNSSGGGANSVTVKVLVDLLVLIDVSERQIIN
jgi:hypothetical protein